MFIWLIKNYFNLRSFMNIKFYPCGFMFNSLAWEVNYKISYNNLTQSQRYLSDQFTKKLKELEGIK